MPSAEWYRCTACDFPNPSDNKDRCQNDRAQCLKFKGDWVCPNPRCNRIVSRTTPLTNNNEEICDHCDTLRKVNAHRPYVPPVRSWSSRERRRGTEYADPADRT